MTTHAEHPHSKIDLGLAVLSTLTPRHVALTCKDIADVCGCRHQYIQQIEARALRKLRIRLSDLLGEEHPEL